MAMVLFLREGEGVEIFENLGAHTIAKTPKAKPVAKSLDMVVKLHATSCDKMQTRGSASIECV